MAKITTIIDIGSNSMRMVVFKKSSRFAFHLINETKSRVKISEGSYNNGGVLQEIPMNRAFNALKSFLSIANSLNSRKILCVATSALRDAPNKKDFINRVKNELKLNIKVIAGEKESFYGGIAALNLLHINDFVTLDIGGGSTELCIVDNQNIQDAISLNVGTVRLRELFFQKGDYDGAKGYIFKELEKYPQLTKLTNPTIVGMGGTARALSRVVLKSIKYPLDVLHGFSYDYEKKSDIFEKIVNTDDTSVLKKLGIKKDRFDTIQEGTFIFKTIVEYLKSKTIFTSGVGVREGVYLTDLLRNSNNKFPSNFNISIRSLLDRFELCEKQTAFFAKNTRDIFDVLKPLHSLDEKYRSLLVIASKLHSIGVTLNFYQYSDHAFTFILNGLSYGISHEDRALIAHIIKYSKKSIPDAEDLEEFKILLPELKTVQWLSFMITLNLRLNVDLNNKPFEYTLDGNKLTVKSDEHIYLTHSACEKVVSPIDMEIEIL